MIVNPVDEHITDHYLVTLAAATEYVRAHAISVLEDAGLWRGPSGIFAIEDLAGYLGISPERLYAAQWLLEEAVMMGFVETYKSPKGVLNYRLVEKPASTLVANTLREIEQASESLGTSIEMIDYVASQYLRFLTGEKSGMAILLKGSSLAVWDDYFSRRNPLYDVHNIIAATGLLHAINLIKRNVRILELGTGTGGGTERMLEALQQSGCVASTFEISDLSPLILNRTKQRIDEQSIGRITSSRRVDFAVSLNKQGIEDKSIDIIVAVNSLHNAGKNLAQVLEIINQALTSDGVLVVSESLCASDTHVHQDFIFNLLPLPACTSETNESSASRFLSIESWQDYLLGSGFNGQIWRNTRGSQLAMLATLQRV